MMIVLAWAPAATSLVLGVVFLSYGEAGPAVKILGTVVFFAALYLQFFSPLPLLGLLVQVGLALCLALWRRMN